MSLASHQPLRACRVASASNAYQDSRCPDTSRNVLEPPVGAPTPEEATNRVVPVRKRLLHEAQRQIVTQIQVVLVRNRDVAIELLNVVRHVILDGIGLRQ